MCLSFHQFIQPISKVNFVEREDIYVDRDYLNKTILYNDNTINDSCIIHMYIFENDVYFDYKLS